VIGHAGRPHPSAGGQYAMASTTRGPHGEVILWGTDAGMEPASVFRGCRPLYPREPHRSCLVYRKLEIHGMENAYDSVEPAPKSARIRGMSLIVGRR